MPRLLLSLFATVLVAAPALAQKDDDPHARRAESLIHRADSTKMHDERNASHGSMDHAGHTGHSPYADDADRAIKALSESERTGLLEGRGLGLALAAELNGYPGPLHVLELADDLDLSAEQRATAERLRTEMLAEARPLGAQIVRMEEHLDALFASGDATTDAVDRVTAHLGEMRGQLRAVHLRAHVALRDVLTPNQLAAYDRLRGYTD